MLEKIKSLKKNKEFIKYFINTSWLLFEKVFRLGLGLFVGIAIARYLGVEQFGIFNYALSVVYIGTIFTYLGLSGILVHELVEKDKQANVLLGTAFFMKLFGAIIAIVIIISFAFITEEFNSDKLWIILIMASSLLLRPIDVIDSFNESIVKAKYSVKAKTYSFIISSIFKLSLIVFSANLLYFGLALPLEYLFLSIFLIYFYKKNKQEVSNWKFSLKKSLYLISKSWKLIISFVFVTIYLKIDQIMLSWMIDDKEVGIYSVAVLLSEAWYFIPTAIVASIFPKLIQIKKQNINNYNNQLQKLYNMLFISALIIAIFVQFFAKDVITFLYGIEYIQSAQILIIHIWASLFIFLRALFSRWIIIENLLILSLYTQALGAICNVILNYLLIPKYGGEGAAYATLISYAVASYVSLFFIKSTRETFFMMTKSFFSPIVYLFLIIKRVLNG